MLAHRGPIMKLDRRVVKTPGPWPFLQWRNRMNQSTAALRKVRIVFEARSGDFRSRYLDITQQPGDSEQTLMARAGDAYRQRYGINQRIVAIRLN